MKSNQSIAFKSLFFNSSAYDIKSLIDIALLSSEKVSIKVNENEYKSLCASYAFLLEHKNVLLLSERGSVNYSPLGFYSINERLIDKISRCVEEDLEGVSVVIYKESSKNFSYRKVSKSINATSSTSFNQMVSFLEGSGYKRKSYVEDVKDYCVKGGIIDFYTPLYQNPIRAYFYDTQTEYLPYEPSTGLPINRKIKSIYLSKNENTLKEIDIISFLTNNKYKPVDREKVGNDGAFLSVFDQTNINKSNKNKKETNKIYFNCYQDSTSIYFPKEKMTLTKKDEELLVPGIDKGDLVCHMEYGIGQYVGLSSFDDKEFVKINFSDGSINLSVSQMYKLSFVSRETNALENIGSLSKKGQWSRKNKSIRKSADNYVDNIVNMYSRRSVDTRPPFKNGGDLENSFLGAFEFEPTKDQTLVWNDICKDLESDYPMSRLLCGDVGFGKTELAIRAAFRVVVNGGKAIILCPTSILAHQHFRVFCDRLSPFGVSVSALYGGMSLSEKNSVKVAWCDQKIDVLVSTSAVLYDIVFIKDASLFVVDEEHRFGVKDKEVVVNSFVNKDVLFMSATPIPRTLHLSLVGVHSISSLSSPPVQRKPIFTSVSYFSKPFVKECIDFELSRGGQVFYLYNRIDSMGSIKHLIEGLCPGASVSVAHSKLGPKAVKAVLLDFANKKNNVLLCSSIIGSGIDIPNANTIIVDKAHMFGLSQLHQIRGRVGRSNKQGFAYLLVPKNIKLNPNAKKRLKSIERNTSLGSGYNIAKNDLDIRGGGSVFGYKQSGNNFDVGYEYYSKVVSECFEGKSNKPFLDNINNFVYNVSFVCCFNNLYIESDYERLRMYRELASLYSVKELENFVLKIRAMYGELDFGANNIINMRKCIVLAAKSNIFNLNYKNSCLTLFYNNNFEDINILIKFLTSNKDIFFIKDFVFGVVNESTNVKIFFRETSHVDGAYIYSFMEAYYVYFKG